MTAGGLNCRGTRVTLRLAQRSRPGREPNGSSPIRDHDGMAERRASSVRAQSRNVDTRQGRVIGFMQTLSTKGYNTFDPKRRRSFMFYVDASRILELPRCHFASAAYCAERRSGAILGLVAQRSRVCPSRWAARPACRIFPRVDEHPARWSRADPSPRTHAIRHAILLSGRRIAIGDRCMFRSRFVAASSMHSLRSAGA